MVQSLSKQGKGRVGKPTSVIIGSEVIQLHVSHQPQSHIFNYLFLDIS